MAKPDKQSFKKAIERNPHLGEYLDEFLKEGNPEPDFYVQLSREMKNMEDINLIYPVGDPIFIHIYKTEGERSQGISLSSQNSRKLLERNIRQFSKGCLRLFRFKWSLRIQENLN